MSNEDLIGKEVAYGPHPVTEEAILNFGIGINDDEAASTDKSHAGFRAHPMYSATTIIPGSGIVLFQEGADFNINRIVHGSIELNFNTLPRVGQTLETKSKLLEIENKDNGGTIIHVEFNTADQNGDTIVNGITRYFSRGKASDKKNNKTSTPEETRELLFEKEMTTLKNQSLLYADGSGDTFPIHTKDSFAQEVGLPGVIMHGMCTLAISARAVVSELADGDSSRLKKLSCKFTNMLLPGQSITVRGFKGEGNQVGFETIDDNGKTVISEGFATIRD